MRQAYLMSRRTRLTREQWPEHCEAVVRVAVRRLTEGHVDDQTTYELRILAALRDAVEKEIRTHVILARTTGTATWREIGKALGMSPQSAHERFQGRARQRRELRPATGEQSAIDEQ